jgi:hypothetical protein
MQGNELGQVCWRYLRFTYADLTQRPGYVVQQIRSALSVLA